MNDALLRLVLIVISGITVISGATQLVAPRMVLGMIASDQSTASQHLFATVGMFMVVTGAMLFQTLVRRSQDPTVPLWIGVQKLAAAALVAWGYSKGLFAPIALGVAGFDLLSGVLVWIYLARRGQ